MVNIYSIHTNKDFWGDPFEFRPERFLDRNNQIIPSKACRVIPFGAGMTLLLNSVCISNCNDMDINCKYAIINVNYFLKSYHAGKRGKSNILT